MGGELCSFLNQSVDAGPRDSVFPRHLPERHSGAAVAYDLLAVYIQRRAAI